MDAMTSFEGDTGPYLQYAHARLCSIFRKAGIPISELENANLSLLTERHAIDLIRLVSRYPDILMNALKTHEPTTILTYLFKMVHALSSSYEVLKVLGSETEVMKARLALYESARVVLNNGMRLLGLSPVDRYVSPWTGPSCAQLKTQQDVSKSNQNSLKHVNLPNCHFLGSVFEPLNFFKHAEIIVESVKLIIQKFRADIKFLE